MQRYVEQLNTDLESAILQQWRCNPPHFYQMGLPDRWLTPPKGYNGPPFGFRIEGDEAKKDEYQSQLEFEKTQAEIENYVQGVTHGTMYEIFGFSSEQFPPSEQLTDKQLEAICTNICRLWAAYNYTAVLPDTVPFRVAYPILLKEMQKEHTLTSFGNFGIEFCDYEPSECPFGIEYCDCKQFGKE